MDRLREVFPNLLPERKRWTNLRRLAGWPARIIVARRTLGQLAGMSDRELADIRLTRQDLRDASALPLGDDPTRIFAMRIGERRAK
jgi:hypothetical protein